MGYDLHITRRKQWFDDGDDITKDEFASYVKEDPEFSYPGMAGDDYADWKSPATGYSSWLCWSDGRIHTKNPESEFVDKIVNIAAQLSAKAQGDDGEIYLSSTEFIQPEYEKESECVDPKKIENWTARIFLFLIIAFFIAFYLYNR